MSNIFYACALILCVAWAVSYFIFNVGVFIHLLPVLAIVSVMLSIIEPKESKQ